MSDCTHLLTFTCSIFGEWVFIDWHTTPMTESGSSLTENTTQMACTYVQCSAVQCSAVQCSSVQYLWQPTLSKGNAVKDNAALCGNTSVWSEAEKHCPASRLYV